ncbi:nuclear GTPase SLIP-GC-like isoform X3 [Garra rufa]|uniref:nuclear GTPase SLIP-GC-like isoform X3 n=1 Tax=Garra rufa TaxID=137080 RepID=UPI003CCE89A5
MAFCKVEEFGEWKEEKDFHFKSDEECKMGEKSDYEPMVYEEDNQSMDRGLTFAVVTLQDTDEVMVVASDWLSTDQKQCYWPPFKSPEKYLETVKSNLEPSTGGKPWEKLNVIFHGKHDTYEEAVNNQVEQRALKDGLILYKVVTLQKSNELTVIPATWLNEEIRQCYWPPFKSPEKCTEAVKNRFEPPVTEKKPWEMLNIQVHWECATYNQAKDKQKALKEQRERFLFKSTLHPAPASSLQISQFSSHGAKRKRDYEFSDSSRESLLTTDMEIMEKAKNIMKRVTDNLVHTIIMHNDIISKINKMYTVNRNKATIGIFGRAGEGKSSLLSAILGKQDLLPSGCFGACTSVVTQVEANLTDSNYIAEIELISKEEWEKELKDLFRYMQDESEDGNEDLIEIAEEKITAVYGADADQKTLEELKKDDKYAEIENLLSNSKKTISESDVSEFATNFAQFIQHNMTGSGGRYWPLVKSVNIKIPDCHELLEHIAIVDIPGTGDCNKTRDDLWKSKLRECSSVWIVSSINRAIDDKDPWGILKHCIEELGPGGECKHINFICTKTDDINPVAYMRSARLTIPKDKDQKIMCIRHRNEEAKTKVKEKFDKSEIKERFRTNNDFLQVFTVSSYAFFDTSLNLESAETEIPKLQDVLRGLNKSINRELVRDYVYEAKGVLSLIQSVQLDTDKKAAETKVTIRKVLENNLMKALNELDTYFDSIYNDLDQCLSKGVEESVQLCVASTMKLVSPAAEKDRRGFHKTLRTLCKNYGYYLPQNRDTVLDLNKRLVEPLYEHVEEIFNQIFPVSGKTGKSVQEHIDKFTIIQSDAVYLRSSVVRHIQNFIKIEEAKLKASLYRTIVELKKDIYTSIIKTILNEMASCYENAAVLTGAGSMKKRQDMLISTVDEKKQDMFHKAKMEVLQKLKNVKLNIKDVLEPGLKKAMDLSLSQSSNVKMMDVSREIDQMEALLKQLSD